MLALQKNLDKITNSFIISINLFYFFVWCFLFNFHIVSNWIMTGNTAQLNKKLGRVEKNVQIVYIFYLNLILLNFCVKSNLIYLKGIDYNIFILVFGQLLNVGKKTLQAVNFKANNLLAAGRVVRLFTSN